MAAFGEASHVKPLMIRQPIVWTISFVILIEQWCWAHCKQKHRLFLYHFQAYHVLAGWRFLAFMRKDSRACLLPRGRVDGMGRLSLFILQDHFCVTGGCIFKTRRAMVKIRQGRTVPGKHEWV
ncbi:hypothetical protein QL093DRAFT_2235426 [Fusarium oxysporum]|nr:hypothetical protein QL093DRAFT_2235426 [Fusarium oxysporum]